MVLSQREKTLLAAVAVVGCLVLFYQYVHEPLFVRRAHALEQAQSVKTDLQREQSKLVKEGNLNARRDTVADKEKVVDAWVPGKNSAALFIWYLSQAELRSGAKIRSISLGEPKEVAAAARVGGNGTNGPAQANGQAPSAAGQQAGAPPAANQQAGAAPAPQANSAAGPTVTVIPMDMKVEARFGEHLLLTQALDDMPLFISTTSFAYSPSSKGIPMDKVSKSLQEGNANLAALLLGQSPALEGTYHVEIYFKGGKVGPTTEPMQFAEQAGRMDPFANHDVDQFIQAVLDFYNHPGGSPGTPASPPGSDHAIPDGPGTRSGQLG